MTRIHDRRVIQPAFLILLIAACDARTAAVPEFCAGIGPGQDYAVSDSAGVEIVTSLRPVESSSQRREQLVLELRLGDDKGFEAEVFGRVADATRTRDGRIIVMDAQSADLRVFDSTGDFIGRHGGRGDGPGEYRSMDALIRSAGDTLWISDIGNRRVTKLDPDLVLVATGNLPPVSWTTMFQGRETRGTSSLRPKGVFRDGSLLVVNSLRNLRTEEITNISRDSLILRHVSADFARFDSLGLILGQQWFEYFPGDGSVVFGEPPFGYVESLAVASDRYYYGAGYTWEIEERRPDGTLLRRIRLCESADTIPPTELDAVIEARLAELSDEARVYEEPALRGIPRPEVAPAYLQLVVDDRDRLWVRDFTFADEPQRWLVISPEGRWLRDVVMPADLEVIEIGDDYVLARETTELDVQLVSLYRFREE